MSFVKIKGGSVILHKRDRRGHAAFPCKLYHLENKLYVNYRGKYTRLISPSFGSAVGRTSLVGLTFSDLVCDQTFAADKLGYLTLMTQDDAAKLKPKAAEMRVAHENELAKPSRPMPANAKSYR